MAYITKKYLSRRTLLRGMGVSIALPMLDSMVPAQTPTAKTAAAAKSRLSCIYVPHGATMDKWTPATQGKGLCCTLRLIETTMSLADPNQALSRGNAVSTEFIPVSGLVLMIGVGVAGPA